MLLSRVVYPQVLQTHPTLEVGYQESTMTDTFRTGDRIEYELGPRKLRRTATVLEPFYANGPINGIKVRVDGMKTTPNRIVHLSCHPRLLTA
jgi:hypothetical protein